MLTSVAPRANDRHIQVNPYYESDMAKKKLLPGFAAPGVLRCTCDADGRLERIAAGQVQLYQRELKQLTEQRYAQLKASMERYGFTAPLLAWRDSDGAVWVLDGHQRLRLLSKECWSVDGGLPIVCVEAADQREAAEKLLVIASQYGQIDKQGLYEFGAFYELDLSAFDLAALPEVDWESFKAEFYGDGSEIPDANKNIDEDAMKDTQNECPKCGFKW